MTVYLLLHAPYHDEITVLRVFLSEQQALDAKKLLEDAQAPGKVTIEEHRVEVSL